MTCTWLVKVGYGASIINNTKISVGYTYIQIWSFYGKRKCPKQQFMYFTSKVVIQGHSSLV